MALSGSTTPMLLVNEKGEQIVSLAVPIQYRKAVQGVLLLSTRPGEIDEVLSEERNVIIALALTAFAATLLASFLLARTIAGPMRRLSEVAENVSRNIKARDELPELAHRADEVGQMAAAFREMTASLYRRIEASERFAQDVAHELKNPLTAARSTAEALAYAKSPEQQQELVRQIQGELKRLNKLITDVSNASRLDAELALQETEPVDMREVLHGVVDVFRDILGGDTRRIVLEIAEQPHNPAAYVVRGHEARLGRVITNLLDNAISFSPGERRHHGARAARRAGDRDRRRGRGPGHPGRQARGHLQALLFGSAADRQHGRQELRAGLEHLARDRQCLRRPHLGEQPHAAGRTARRPGTTIRPSCGTGACRASPGPASPFGCRRPMPRHPRERRRLPDATELVHGTCVALGRTAALLRGPSGSGKSDLALRFLFLARRGPAALEPPILVADDQVWLVRNGERLLARPPDTIRGKMEVRGVGIVEVKSLLEAELVLVVDLVPARRDRAAARGRRHGPPAGRRAAPDRAVPVGGLGPHQAGDRTGARETQLIHYG